MSPTSSTPVFKLKNTMDGIRQGIITTRAGNVYTPTFMPDGTRGAVKSLTPEMVRGTGVQVVLANTYHLHMQPGEDVIADLGGLHKFSNQSLPILTDSGGFQVFSLAHINKITEDGVSFKDPKTGDTIFLSPEKSIQFQMKLGADMMVAFDDVTSLDEKGRARTKEAFDRTHRWLKRSLAEFQQLTKSMKPSERPLLFGVVQGGLDKKLRKKSLEIVQSLPVDGIAIGGLSVGENKAEMHDMLEFLAPLYDESARPRFLLGVGDPIDLRFAVEHGIDMFDCVLPTRNARHATAWQKGCVCDANLGEAKLSVRSGASQKKFKISSQRNSSASYKCSSCGQFIDQKIHLTNTQYATDSSVIDPGCDCYACQEGFSKGFLRHQFKVGEPLAGTLVSIHNIRYLERICEQYRSKV